MGVTYMRACALFVCAWSQKRTSDPLELELQVSVRHRLGSEISVRVLVKSMALNH